MYPLAARHDKGSEMILQKGQVIIEFKIHRGSVSIRFEKPVKRIHKKIILMKTISK